MSEITSLEDLLHDELRDLYDAEKRLTKAIPKMAKKAADENLRAALQAHLAETETQIERLERAFELMDEKASEKTCAGMKGILDEAKEHMSEDFDPHDLIDVVIIGAAQRVEHYEIAAYGNAIAHAKAIGQTEIAALLEESLAEEKAADEKLTQIGEPLNAATHAASQDDDEDVDEDEDDDDDDDEDEDDEDEDEDEEKDEKDDEEKEDEEDPKN
jgi:ferritin-like metal-binding protein YciE